MGQHLYRCHGFSVETSAADAFFGGDIELLTGSIIDYWLVADGVLMGFLRKFYGLRAEL